MKPPEIVSALVTPFDPDGAVDFDAFDRVLERLKPLVDGVFVAGTTGEFPALADAERTALIARALAVFGPSGVVAHVGAASTHDALRLTTAAADAGAERFAAITPYYLAASPQGTASYFAALRKELPTQSLYAYLFPDVAVTDVLPEAFAVLADTGIDGVKVSGTASTRVAEYLAAAPAGLRLWSGNDADLPAVMAAGGVGTVSGVSSVCPGPWAAYRDAVRDGHDAAAAEAQRTIQTLVAALGPSIERLRFGLAELRCPVGRSRMPIDLPDHSAKDAIRMALTAAGSALQHTPVA